MDATYMKYEDNTFDLVIDKSRSFPITFSQKLND